MWLRNVFFLGLVGGGVFALGVGLMPPREPKPLTRFDADAYRRRSFAPPSLASMLPSTINGPSRACLRPPSRRT